MSNAKARYRRRRRRAKLKAKVALVIEHYFRDLVRGQFFESERFLQYEPPKRCQPAEYIRLEVTIGGEP